MGIYSKRNGELVKIAGNIVQRQNTRWFLCSRTVEQGIEYYDVPIAAQSYFNSIDAHTIYSLGFNEPNTTITPRLRYGSTVLTIKDFTNSDLAVVVGQLSGVYQMFTQNLATDPTMYFVGNVQSSLTNYYNKAETNHLLLENRKQLILTGEGVLENNVYNFTIDNAEDYLEYRTNGTVFLLDLYLPLTGAIANTNMLAITFGDTTYYVKNILTDTNATIAELKQVDKYNNEVGYRFVTEMTFMSNEDLTGFTIFPTVSMSDVLSLTSNQLDTYMLDGGLTDGQLAVCYKSTNTSYIEGALYRFDITYPSTYEWTVLARNTHIPVPTTNDNGKYMQVQNGEYTLSTNPIDKVTSATVGNIPQFISGGGLEDSGTNIVDMSMTPSNRSIDITVVNNGTLTAPANGYYSIQSNGNDGFGLGLKNTTSGLISLIRKYASDISVFLPVKKNDVITMQYEGNVIYSAKFIYAENQGD